MYLKAVTILSIAYPFAPVGPDAVGGAEQILTVLDAALVRAGHRSLVIACEGSSCAGTLIPTPAWTEIGGTAWRPAHRAMRDAVADTIRRYPVDVVHHHGLDFAAYLPPPGPPVVATLHLAPDRYPPQALSPERPRTWLHCVSESQQSACPDGIPLLPLIPNGVDLGALPEIVEPGRTGFLVETVEEMAEAFLEVETLDPRECRRAAEERFSAETMIERYFDLYHRLADGEEPLIPALAGSAHA